MKQPTIFTVLFYNMFQITGAIRPAFENDPELCPFTNRLTINELPAEMTPRINGMKYFRRTNDSKEEVTMDKVNSICRMYNLEAAEILDQDDYNEAIAIVKETGWSFWINVKGKYTPELGSYQFDFVLADGHTKLGFHDFGHEEFLATEVQTFETHKEGCVTIEPNPKHPSGVNWSKEVCIELKDILCQYKQSCYRRSDYMKDPTRPIKRLIPIPLLPNLEESGFAISTHQATWPFAKQVCEDADMQLLWFTNDAEQSELVKLLNVFTEGKVQYQGKSFWTAGRFSPTDAKGEIYSKFYWWVHNRAIEVSNWDLDMARSGEPEASGGFLKKWGKDRESAQSDNAEPYDEGQQGAERCVDASFGDDDDDASYFTSKCDKSLRYFICIKRDVVKQTVDGLGTGGHQPSFMDYCDGVQYRKTRGKDCNGEIAFGQNKPECTCYSGVHVLMADIRCKPRLLVGTGCTVLKAKSSVHWKILPSDIISDSKPWIIVVHNSDERNGMFNWFFADIQESKKRQVLGASTFFFSGFDLYRDMDKDDLCFIMNTTALERNEYYEYSVPDLSSVTMRHYYYEEDCASQRVPVEKMVKHRIHVEKNDCTFQSCTRKEVGEDLWESYIPLPSTMPHGCADGTDTCDDIHDEEGQMLVKKAASTGKAEGDIEDVNDNLNRQVLIHAIEMAFPYNTEPFASATSGPVNTWRILEKLFELAKQTCNKMVHQDFLTRVLKYFKIAHYGENYEYGEYFSDSETKQILSMLDACREKTFSMREMDVEVDSCSGKASKIVLENKTREIISRSADDLGYQTVFHHHVIEATWDVIDLSTAVCINQFKPSYLLFHHMERGLEILFTEKLRKLWHFPNVTEEYYEKLLGPNEGIQLLNLDQCVVAAYRGNMRTNRMSRPLKGRNTVVSQMIRNRLEEKKLREDGVVTMINNIRSPTKINTACVRGNSIHCHKKERKTNKQGGYLQDMVKKG